MDPIQYNNYNKKQEHMYTSSNNISASQPKVGRGQNLTKIDKVRTDEELLSDEIDLYINH